MINYSMPALCQGWVGCPGGKLTVEGYTDLENQGCIYFIPRA